MNEKILLVDDDPRLLASCERLLRKHYTVETAEGGEPGLAKMESAGPFAVVVADRQMPGMDGIRFLATVKERAPDTIRIMLTGNADLESAIQVVNEGSIFRFLTKPCPPELLLKALGDALEQHRLVNAERELLQKTLNGSIKILTDILSLSSQDSFGRAQHVRETITIVTDKLGIQNAWEIHLAVMLAPIGFVTIPPELLVKSRSRQPLSELEERVLSRVPDTAARLLANIPRLEGVSRIIAYQHKHFDGTGLPADSVAGDAIPLGARLLKILSDLSDYQQRGLDRSRAFKEMENLPDWYDPALLAAVRGCLEQGDFAHIDAGSLSKAVTLKELAPGMLLRSNVETRDGTLILSAGHRLGWITLERVRNFARLGGLKEPILVENTE